MALLAVLAVVPATARVEAQTAPGPLGNPVGLTASSGPGVGAVTLAWTPAANATLHLVYWIADGDDGEIRWRLADAAGSATFSDLEAGREYWFIVIAGQVGVAWSEWSEWAKAQALAALPPPELDGNSAIAAGGKHTCYLDGAASVQCWGANGDADQGQADPPDGAFTAISAGYEHTCGIRAAGGEIECWGDNSSGQSAPPAGSFAAVSAGRAHTSGGRIPAGCGRMARQPAGAATNTGRRTRRRGRCSMQ